uniref:Uncharacterized protein n=1 Tax=Caenorhabditis japonica TaxID=281687 RepID=A0A8R1EK50_CAEJA
MGRTHYAKKRGRWTRLVQEYYPIGEKRPVGKPRMRWSYSLKKYHYLMARISKHTGRQSPKKNGLECCDPRPNQVIEKLID